MAGPNTVLAMDPRNVVVMQPQFTAAQQPSQWQTGMMDCCSDCGVCLCGTFCYSCLGCQVAGDLNECCMCGTSVAIRTLYRTRYNIPGSILNDYFATACCPWCTLCQLKRDINRRKAQGIFW